jgi:cell division protease FtsH
MKSNLKESSTQSGGTDELTPNETTASLASIKERINLLRRLAGATGDVPAESTTVESADSPAGDDTIANKDQSGSIGLKAEKLRLYFHQLKTGLSERVLGQPQAIDVVTDSLLKGEMVGGGGPQPRAVFLFVGPPGTGKGLTAQALADSLDGYNLLTLDLSSIVNENHSTLIDGDEPTFSNAAPGKLTSHVMKHPKTVVLLRNVDRCHPNVLARLNTPLTTGYMLDRFGLNAKGEPKQGSDLPTDFTRSILIFSTSAGDSAYQDPNFQKVLAERPSHAGDMLLDELASLESRNEKSSGVRQFSPIMLNCWRGGRTVLFQPLGLQTLEQLARNAVQTHVRLLQDHFGINITGHLDSTLLQACLLSFAPATGAAEATGAMPNQLFKPLLDRLLQVTAIPNEVSLSISPEALGQWNDFLQLLTRSSYKADLLDRCNRRGLKLDLKWAVSAECKQVTLTDLQLGQVKAGADLRGPGAVKIQVPDISFDKIAGHLVVKERMTEVVRLLTQSHDPHIRPLIPTGMLLYGPPGTGKTMLAKALAHEADLPFISTTGTEVANIGLMRAIFARARKYAPSIVFIDEIDALGCRDSGGATPVINQLLTEMDGFDTGMNGMVFVIAATNLPNHVDPALRRAGRLDLHLEVPPLDPPARRYFVDRIFAAVPMAADVQAGQVVQLTVGMSGADLEQLKRELQLARLRQGKATVTAAVLLETINTLRYGQRSTENKADLIKAHTAIHEAGHAVINQLVNPDRLISHISIVPRAHYEGFVAYDADSASSRRHTLSEVMDDICVALAGRAAQELEFGDGEADSGAASDLEKATRLATLAVGHWGLLPNFGLLALPGDAAPTLQQAVSAELLVAVRQLLQQADQRCRQLLKAHWQQVKNLQKRLIEEEFVLGTSWWVQPTNNP